MVHKTCWFLGSKPFPSRTRKRPSAATSMSGTLARMKPSCLPSGTEWYKPGNDDPNLDPVHEAFQKGVEKFATVLTKDPRKVALVSQTDEIQDLQEVVAELQTKYESKRAKGTAHKWLMKFSKRVAIYGNILDVLVQHHPEYVALIWGAMKFLFVAVDNHEALLSCMSKGLVQIADSLPRLELAAVLFPTERMKSYLADIYANIIRFFIRVHDWFETNKFIRAVQSITRPSELRYHDLLEDITVSTRNIEHLAVTASQAEQRDMHNLMLEMKQMMIAHQQINSAAQLNTNQALTDLQFSQILIFLSNLPLEDPDKSLQHALFMRNRGRRKPIFSNPFWLTSKFQAWNSATRSSMVMIKGSFSSQSAIKNFLTDAVVCVRQSSVPVVWALKTLDSTDSRMTVVDLLKYLTCQVLKLQRKPTEGSMSLDCARFQTARNEKEWFNLLAASLVILKHVYIILDLELLSLELTSVTDGFSLPAAFSGLFEQLGKRSSNTVVKVMLVSYGSSVLTAADERSQKSLILVNRRRLQKHPKSRIMKSKRVIRIDSKQLS